MAKKFIDLMLNAKAAANRKLNSNIRISKENPILPVVRRALNCLFYLYMEKVRGLGLGNECGWARHFVFAITGKLVAIGNVILAIYIYRVVEFI